MELFWELVGFGYAIAGSITLVYFVVITYKEMISDFIMKIKKKIK